MTADTWRDFIKKEPELLKEVQKYGYLLDTFRDPKVPFFYPGHLIEPFNTVSEAVNLNSNSVYSEFIKCIEAILNTNVKLKKVKDDLTMCNLNSPYLFNHPAAIEKKINRLADELHRVRAVIEFQAHIQMKLQTYNFRFIGMLPSRLSHHKALMELMNVLPKMTKELKENVLNLELFIKYQPGRNIDKISVAIAQTFSLLDYINKRLRELYSVLKRLHGVQGKSLVGTTDEEVLSNYNKSAICEWKEQKKLNELLLDPTYFVQYSKSRLNKKM